MMSQRGIQLKKVQEEGFKLFEKKNQDYGDAFATYGTVGILVRMGDKIHRLQSITSKGINLVEDEKLRDTLIDLHNYAAMGVMLLDEKDEKNEITSPNPVELPQPKLILSKCEERKVIGSQGNEYILKKYIHSDDTFHMTCTCPSFRFCKLNYKTCKHITNHLAENEM